MNNKMTCRYIKYKLLGKGTYGSVYLARKENAGILNADYIALKVINLKDGLFGTDIIEMNMLKILNHKNILHSSNINILHNKLQIELPLQKCSLDKIIESTMPQNIIHSIFEQLLEAVNYLHSNGIAHHDLKPANIMCNFNKYDMNEIKDPHIDLIDFGLSIFEKYYQNTEKDTIVVTLPWRAPELVKFTSPFEKYNSYLVDMWSVGVILLECLKKRVAFYYDDEEDIGNKHASFFDGRKAAGLDIYPIITASEYKSFSFNYFNLIDGLLQEDPKDRLSSNNAIRIFNNKKRKENKFVYEYIPPYKHNYEQLKLIDSIPVTNSNTRHFIKYLYSVVKQYYPSYEKACISIGLKLFEHCSTYETHFDDTETMQEELAILKLLDYTLIRF